MSDEIAKLQANAQTQTHIDLIRKLLNMAAVELLHRGEIHDQSKFSPAEVDVFTDFTPKLKGCTYGSDEYKSFLAQMKPALDHHYANNRHHPEHFADGIEGMNLIDVLEMFIDWLASSKRHDDGNILRSIEINRERFGMSDQLVRLFQNTAADFTVAGVTAEDPRAKVRATFERARMDCIQDGCENAPFASIGGLEARSNMKAPRWIAAENANEYLAGYRAEALKQYGSDWETCQFSWSAALEISA